MRRLCGPHIRTPLQAGCRVIVYLPVHSRQGVKDVLKKICMTALCAMAMAAQAADDKKWVRLDACRYVADKNNDGDSFLVQCGREKFYARFYFIDAPESDVTFPERVRQQYDYFGVTMDELTRGGAKARDYVQRTLSSRPFVIHTRHSSAQGRAKTVRYYSLVEVDGRYLHEAMLSEGLARNFGTRVTLPTGQKGKPYADALAQLEDRARLQRKGLWATSDPAKRKSPL
jgi:endonuclease YncB( thermonuclease family)